MPLMSSFGALKQQRYSVALPNPGTDNWFNAVDVKVDSPSVVFGRYYLKIISGNPYNYGSQQGTISGNSIYRPFVTNYNDNTGALSYNKVFSDLAFVGGAYRTISGLEIDTSSNKHIITNNYRLMKYNSSDSFVTASTFTEATDIGEVQDMVIDSSNNLYILSTTGAYFILSQLSASSYTVNWSKKVTITVDNNSILKLDNAGNLCVSIYTASGSVNTIFKFDNTGSILWQKSFTGFSSDLYNAFALDSSSNIYVLNKTGPTGTIAKIDNTGSFVYAKNIPTVNGVSGNFKTITVNSFNNIVVLHDNPAGATLYNYTVTLDNNGNVLNSARIAMSSGNDPQLSALELLSNNGHLYLKGYIYISSGARTDVNFRLPNNNDIIYNTPYNFTVTTNNGTTRTYTGNIITTSQTNPTITSTSITLSNTAYTTSNVTLNTSSYTPSTQAVTPFSYNVTLV